MRQRAAKAILFLVATQKNELHQLLDKTPCGNTSQRNATPIPQHSSRKKKGLINIRGDRGVHHNATIVNQTEHKSCVRDLTSCQGVLESPYSLSPAGSKDQTGPGENPDRPNPNCRKGTEDPKTRDMTDTSTGKKPASSGQAMAQKRPLANYSNH